MLEEALRDRKLRTAATEVFKELQKDAVVENVYNDPVASRRMPGIAAVINGHKISVRELAEECIERHGTEVLDGTVNRRLLDQAMRKQGMKVTDADLDDEIGRAALAMGKTLPNGKPDIDAWIEHVTKSERISRRSVRARRSLAFGGAQKLVGDHVQITREDLQRGYEANYGPKVRCRAIVVKSERQAHEVWEKARDNQTVENFGRLAEQYSIEASSRSLRGEVPPIQKNGGQPMLEKEAFTLKPGEISGVIQVGGTFVILFCEGYTKPVKTDFNEVKDLLYRDIHEKKQRIAMAEKFDYLKDSPGHQFPQRPDQVAQERAGRRDARPGDQNAEGYQAVNAQSTGPSARRSRRPRNRLAQFATVGVPRDVHFLPSLNQHSPEPVATTTTAPLAAARCHGALLACFHRIGRGDFTNRGSVLRTRVNRFLSGGVRLS